MFTVDDVAEAILPFADVHGELRYEGSLRMVLSSQVPVEVMCRLTHLFVHDIDTKRQSCAHRRNLIELGVGPQSISDYFVEVIKVLPRAEREALWCRSNLARVNFPKYWPEYAYSRAFLTPRAFSLAYCVFSQRPFHQSSLGGRVPAVAKVTSTPWVPIESNRFCRTFDRVAVSIDSAISSRGGHLISALFVTGFQSCVYLASVFACRVGLRCRPFAGRDHHEYIGEPLRMTRTGRQRER